MDPAQHRAAILLEGGALAAIPAKGLSARVRGCPGWDVERLIGHTGRVHRWAAAFIAQGADDGGDAGPRPPEGAAVLPWYRESLDLLVAELDRHDPTDAADTFAGPADVAFWLRRQAHEISVHRWDAEDAIAPGDAMEVQPALAADGIDEWLTFFVPRFLFTKGTGVPAELVGSSLHIHCTDGLDEGIGEWLIRFGDRRVEVDRVHAKGDAALRGPASDLLLAVWHRVPLAAVDVVGDAAHAQRVLDLIHVT